MDANNNNDKEKPLEVITMEADVDMGDIEVIDVADKEIEETQKEQEMETQKKSEVEQNQNSKNSSSTVSVKLGEVLPHVKRTKQFVPLPSVSSDCDYGRLMRGSRLYLPAVVGNEKKAKKTEDSEVVVVAHVIKNKAGSQPSTSSSTTIKGNADPQPSATTATKNPQTSMTTTTKDKTNLQSSTTTTTTIEANSGDDKEVNYDIPDESRGGYYCRLCDSHVHTEEIWYSHIHGKRHKKKLSFGPPDATLATKYSNSNAEAKLMKKLKDIQLPVVGLDFITETQLLSGMLQYSCNICHGTYPKTKIISHITGGKHQLTYIQKVDPEWAKLVIDFKKNSPAREGIISEKASMMEEQYGKGKIRVRVRNIHASQPPKLVQKDTNDVTAEKKQNTLSPAVSISQPELSDGHMQKELHNPTHEPSPSVSTTQPGHVIRQEIPTVIPTRKIIRHNPTCRLANLKAKKLKLVGKGTINVSPKKKQAGILSKYLWMKPTKEPPLKKKCVTPPTDASVQSISVVVTSNTLSDKEDTDASEVSAPISSKKNINESTSVLKAMIPQPAPCNSPLLPFPSDQPVHPQGPYRPPVPSHGPPGPPVPSHGPPGPPLYPQGPCGPPPPHVRGCYGLPRPQGPYRLPLLRSPYRPPRPGPYRLPPPPQGPYRPPPPPQGLYGPPPSQGPYGPPPHGPYGPPPPPPLQDTYGLPPPPPCPQDPYGLPLPKSSYELQQPQIPYGPPPSPISYGQPVLAPVSYDSTHSQPAYDLPTSEQLPCVTTVPMSVSPIVAPSPSPYGLSNSKQIPCITPVLISVSPDTSSSPPPSGLSTPKQIPCITPVPTSVSPDTSSSPPPYGLPTSKQVPCITPVPMSVSPVASSSLPYGLPTPKQIPCITPVPMLVSPVAASEVLVPTASAQRTCELSPQPTYPGSGSAHSEAINSKSFQKNISLHETLQKGSFKHPSSSTHANDHPPSLESADDQESTLSDDFILKIIQLFPVSQRFQFLQKMIKKRIPEMEELKRNFVIAICNILVQFKISCFPDQASTLLLKLELAKLKTSSHQNINIEGLFSQQENLQQKEDGQTHQRVSRWDKPKDGNINQASVSSKAAYSFRLTDDLNISKWTKKQSSSRWDNPRSKDSKSSPTKHGNMSTTRGGKLNKPSERSNEAIAFGLTDELNLSKWVDKLPWPEKIHEPVLYSGITSGNSNQGFSPSSRGSWPGEVGTEASTSCGPSSSNLKGQSRQSTVEYRFSHLITGNNSSKDRLTNIRSELNNKNVIPFLH